MQVYSQVGLLEGPYFFTNAPGRGQAPPLPYYESSCPVSHPGRGQAPPLHFFVFAFDGVVAGATALVGWCILLCATKV
jgi:hypothetical protein